MDIFGSVQTDSDGETFIRQKTAPVLIEKRPVSLKPIDDASPARLMLVLERDDSTKIFQTQDGRFTAMPGKSDHIGRGGLDLLANITFEQVPGHAHNLGFSIQCSLGKIVTIVAEKVATGTARFDENLEISGSLKHK